jgi:hypothetical protein
MSPEELLEEVRDRESFIAFARALADERERAEQIERDNPSAYGIDGALGWHNGDISGFIFAGLAHFEDWEFNDEQPIETPTWQDLAKFLFCGKVVE